MRMVERFIIPSADQFIIEVGITRPPLTKNSPLLRVQIARGQKGVEGHVRVV